MIIKGLQSIQQCNKMCSPIIKGKGVRYIDKQGRQGHNVMVINKTDGTKEKIGREK